MTLKWENDRNFECAGSPPRWLHAITPRHHESRRGAVAMPETMKFDDKLLQALDGFRVELDAARERADIVLDRPPLNVIVMPQRDQLRAVFEALDAEDRVR